jgi:hypothetical protein
MISDETRQIRRGLPVKKSPVSFPARGEVTISLSFPDRNYA